MSADLLGAARTLLFVPGNRPERFAKAVAAGPDIVVIDLEDAVGAGDKDTARDHAREWFAAGNPGVVRINGHGTPWYDADLAMVGELDVPALVPKASDPAVLAAITGADVPVVALIETAAGVLAAHDVARVPGVHRLAFGSIDLAAEYGVDPNDRDALQMSRSMLVTASAAAGLAPPIDGVTTALTDQDALVCDLQYARRIGMTAKLCIHPSQVEAVHHGLRPSDDEISWAQRIVDSGGPDGSATAHDGHMIDAPVIARARRILADAARTGIHLRRNRRNAPGTEEPSDTHR
jgi:citrate lyase subunit beta/citryl-CoA lyase